LGDSRTLMCGGEREMQRVRRGRGGCGRGGGRESERESVREDMCLVERYKVKRDVIIVKRGLSIVKRDLTSVTGTRKTTLARMRSVCLCVCMLCVCV
jgi:hypothetical protein